RCQCGMPGGPIVGISTDVSAACLEDPWSESQQMSVRHAWRTHGRNLNRCQCGMPGGPMVGISTDVSAACLEDPWSESQQMSVRHAWRTHGRNLN
ncbi:hypothetical protein LSAT2_004240, partial [Lamellibrachia satsuma]